MDHITAARCTLSPMILLILSPLRPVISALCQPFPKRGKSSLLSAQVSRVVRMDSAMDLLDLGLLALETGTATYPICHQHCRVLSAPAHHIGV